MPLPGKVNRVRHLAAMPVDDAPSFMRELAAKNSTDAMALRLAILTAARFGEIRSATCGEIDRKAKVWTDPREWMKGGREHKLPMCRGAVALQGSLPGADDAQPFYGWAVTVRCLPVIYLNVLT